MKKYIGLISAMVLLLISAPTAVFAQGRPDISEKRQQAREEVMQARENAKPPKPDIEERKTQIKEEVAERKATIKQEVCERRQERLSSTLPKLSNGATSVKSAIDKVYERVQGFYESNQLTIDDYPSYIEEIEIAKADAEAALLVVADYNFEIDCENQNVGEQIDAYRVAVNDARDSLKDYRKALVSLITGLRAEAASSQDNESVDEDSGETTEEEADTEQDSEELEDVTEETEENQDVQQ